MHLPPFKLERYFARYEFDVEYLLCASDCESTSVQELLALEPEAAERLQQLRLGYSESAGSPALRQAIAGMYTTIQPEQVLVFSGAEEAIYLFMQARLGPGDHVVVHWPCYQSLYAVAQALGCQISPWAAREEHGWSLDLDVLDDLLRPNTRAIILNTPHNPTGYLMPAEDFAALNRLAQARGMVLFSDEVYRESEYDPATRLPAACDVNEIAISLGVLSKTYGLPGLRIGWIATHDAELYQQLAALKDYTTICNSAPSELLAEVAVRHRESLAGRNVARIKRNLSLLTAFFSRHQELLSWQPPKAGPIAFPRLLQGEVEAFCDRLVREASVLLLPGDIYDDTGNHFRLGFGRENMPEALQQWEAWLRR